jgi:hypothetical protein
MRALSSLLCVFAAFFAFATPARAAPLEGTWYAVPATLTPVGGRETYSVTAHTTPSGAITFQISFFCSAVRPCSQTMSAVTLGGPDQYIAGNFVAPAPKRLFIFVHETSCTSRYGAAAFLGIWTDNGSAPFIAQCYVNRVIALPGGVGPAPRPLPAFRVPAIPPYVLRPGALPAPNPSPRVPQPVPPG